MEVMRFCRWTQTPAIPLGGEALLCQHDGMLPFQPVFVRKRGRRPRPLILLIAIVVIAGMFIYAQWGG